MSYASVTLHVVFSTKGREGWIVPEIEPRMHAYIGGIVKEQRCAALCIGGVEDHVHLLIGLRPDVAISDLLRHVKTRSSRWMHEIGIREFAWQPGYAVFSVSASAAPRVRRYIERQKAHHAERDFLSELKVLLDAHGVEYDEQFIR